MHTIKSVLPGHTFLSFRSIHTNSRTYVQTPEHMYKLQNICTNSGTSKHMYKLRNKAEYHVGGAHIFTWSESVLLKSVRNGMHWQFHNTTTRIQLQYGVISYVHKIGYLAFESDELHDSEGLGILDRGWLMMTCTCSRLLEGDDDAANVFVWLVVCVVHQQSATHLLMWSIQCDLQMVRLSMGFQVTFWTCHTRED